MFKNPFNTKNKIKQEQAKQEALKKEREALREKVANLAVEYNSLTHKRFITIRNLEKTSLKNEVVSQASGGYSGSFLGASGNYDQNDKIIGAGIVYFMQTKNKIDNNSLCQDNTYYPSDMKAGQAYILHSNYVPLPLKLDTNLTSVRLYKLQDAINTLKQLKNDFSSVEIVQKQITDIEGKPAIEFKESGNENSYYDICYPNTLYLNQEDWNKIIGI